MLAEATTHETRNPLEAVKFCLQCRRPWIAGSRVLCNPAMQVQSLDQEDPLEKGMAIHSSILASNREAW